MVRDFLSAKPPPPIKIVDVKFDQADYEERIKRLEETYRTDKSTLERKHLEEVRVLKGCSDVLRLELEKGKKEFVESQRLIKEKETEFNAAKHEIVMMKSKVSDLEIQLGKTEIAESVKMLENELVRAKEDGEEVRLKEQLTIAEERENNSKIEKEELIAKHKRYCMNVL